MMFLRTIFVFFILVFAANSSAFNGFDLSKLGGNDPAAELLPDDQAFQVINSRIDGQEIVVTWFSAPEYYLYRQNFKLVSKTEGVSFGELILPKGEIEEDPLFGSVEVYFGEVDVRAKILFSDEGILNAGAKNIPSQELQFDIHSQGCNKPVGICYPPQKRQGSVSLADYSTATGISANTTTENLNQVGNEAISPNVSKSYWAYILSAFGAGLLLVFTPCVLPMLPILSGLIVGSSGSDNLKTSKLRAGMLSLAYVLGTAVTYTSMGVAAGAAGIQLQAYFQHPVAILVMAAILVVLALSMFGLFNIALPAGAQGKISAWTNRLKGGSLAVAFIVGLLSALIVSACVSPLLITALGVAIREGNPLLGGVMMFSMAMGMGVLLIAFGMGAGWIMPRAGEWMNQVKVLFGFAILGVAISVASGLSWMPTLFLWAALLALFGFWLWSLNAKSGLKIILRAIAFLSLLWAATAFFGGLTGGMDITRPLDSLSLRGGSEGNKSVAFDKVYSGEALNKAIMRAKELGKPVLVDYYADWCTDCKRMDRSTYQSGAVIDALDSWARIKVDVTEVNGATQKAKDQFGVFGPPATLFIDSQGQEKNNLRRYGYINEAELLELVNAATR